LCHYSKRLAEQHKVVEKLEQDKERLSHKVCKLEKQLLSETAADRDHGDVIDTVRIQIKHKVTN